MTEDWKNYKSGKATKAVAGQDLTNPGLPVLNDQDEYIFQLQKVILKRAVEGFKAGEKVDKFYTTWKEETTGNILMMSFRVDKLRFKIGIPIREGDEPVWQSLFIEGMRIRGRVQPVTKDRKTTGGYRMEIATVRKYMV
jgi:hypothetical protein